MGIFPGLSAVSNVVQLLASCLCERQSLGNTQLGAAIAVGSCCLLMKALGGPGFLLCQAGFESVTIVRYKQYWLHPG